MSVRFGWALKWRSKNHVDGLREYIMLSPHPMVFNQSELYMGLAVFKTRKRAREYREQFYGYIRNRPDLKAEPHGWKMPQVVKVRLIAEEIE